MITSPYVARAPRSLSEYRAELVMHLDIRRHESDCVCAMRRRLMAALDEFEDRAALARPRPVALWDEIA